MTRASKTQASEPRAWQNRAACRDADPEVFYPDLGGSYAAAKQICGGCRVRDECLAVAIRCKDLNGVWGGLTPDERRELEDAALPRADPGGLPQPELRMGAMQALQGSGPPPEERMA